MNKNLIYRIIGALSSTLIVVSVFLTYYSEYDYNFSLWSSNASANSLFLPIIIIVFGVIGIIFFALNFKTEFAYSTCGATLFYSLIDTFNFTKQGTFSNLSIGYYFLLIGSILTGIMAFVCNMRAKVKKIEPISDEPKQDISSIKTDNFNNSMPVIEPINDNINFNNVNGFQDSVNEPIPEINENIVVSPIPEINENMMASPQVNNINTQMPQNPNIGIPNVEPTQLQQFDNQVQNANLNQFNMPQENLQNIPNNMPNIDRPVNPVLQQFDIPSQTVKPSFMGSQLEQNEQKIVNVQPQMNTQPTQLGNLQSLSNNNQNPISNANVNNFNNVNSQTSKTDIFGQPLN